MTNMTAKIVLEFPASGSGDPVYECKDVIITIGNTRFSVLELLAKVALETKAPT